MFAFTCPFGKFTNTIILYDRWTGETRQIEDIRLDLKNTKAVVVKSEVFSFKNGSPVSVCKYGQLKDTYLLKKTTLSTLPHMKSLKYFSVANRANKSIILTGGHGDEGVSAKTFGIDVITGKWQE